MIELPKCDPICNQGHAMIQKIENPYKDIKSFDCDRCDKEVNPKDGFRHCMWCQTDYCHECIKRSGENVGEFVGSIEPALRAIEGN